MSASDPSSQLELPDKLTDVLYTGVGLGVLAVNRIQVARRHARQARKASGGVDSWTRVQQAMANPESARAVLTRLHQELQDFDDRAEGIESQITALLDRIEPDLPPGAKELVAALRDLAADHTAQVRAVLGLKAR